MLKQIYKYTVALLFLGVIASCSSDTLPDMPPAESDVPIQLSGMLTRAALNGDEDGELIETGYSLDDYTTGVSFYLTARTVGTPESNYFLNSPIAIGDHGDDVGRNKLTGTVYYPLGRKAIDLYAHTVAADANGNITLTAGTGRVNDVLSGKGTNKDGTTLKSGQSDDPVEYITFKHLMTRVDVKIEVAEDVVSVTPQSFAMNFVPGENSIVATGNYNIFAGDYGNYVGNSSSGTFGFTLNDAEINSINPKTYYLVPNGVNLTTAIAPILSYLKIDDYVATADDLAPIRFPQTDQGNDFILNPGLAYDLTFKINRLKITEIKLTLKNWDTKGGTSEWSYEPKTMTLTGIDEYDITKMVLKYRHTDGKVYQYIGEGKTNQIDFVTLPADLSAGTLTADLYTNGGLLADNVEIESSDAVLNVLKLGKYGMKKEGDIYEISTPLQFTLMINDEGKPENQQYRLTKDIDMGNTAVSLIPTMFPKSSVLDGAGHDILNLNITGNGLFTENNGTLKNFRIASGQVTGSGTGAIGAICQTNNGTIEAVVNEANIRPAAGQTVAGGISGINGASGTIVATVNTGNVLGGTTVGGIAGDNQNPDANAIIACINAGMLNKGADMLGGIVGTSESGTSVVNTSFWLTGTARKNQAVSGELAIGDNPANATDMHSADLAASVIRSAVTIGKLNDALAAVLSPWKFELDTDKSSWPIAKPKP